MVNEGNHGQNTITRKAKQKHSFCVRTREHLLNATLCNNSNKQEEHRKVSCELHVNLIEKLFAR